VNARNNGWTALMVAVSMNHTKCFNLLMEHNEIRVNVANDENWTALQFAAESNDQMCVELARRQETDVNVKDKLGITPLMRTILKNKKRCFDVILMRKDVKVNAANMWKETALQIATEFDEQMCVDLSEKAETNVNVRSELGSTPLMKAIRQNKKLCFDALMKRDIEVNAMNRWKMTALHYAAKSTNQKMCARLAGELETDVIVKDEDGMTPLMSAASSHRFECIKALLKRNAKIDEKDNFGRTALDFLRAKSSENKEDFEEVRKLLQKNF